MAQTFSSPLLPSTSSLNQISVKLQNPHNQSMYAGIQHLLTIYNNYNHHKSSHPKKKKKNHHKSPSCLFLNLCIATPNSKYKLGTWEWYKPIRLYLLSVSSHSKVQSLFLKKGLSNVINCNLKVIVCLCEWVWSC